LLWGRRLDGERVGAIEDCRHVSGALERFLIARGERVVRVAPKLTAGADQTVRASAVSPMRSMLLRSPAPRSARASTRSQWRRSRVLSSMSAARRSSRAPGRFAHAADHDLRWNLHDLRPELEIPARGLIAVRWPERTQAASRAEPTTRVRIARDELRSIRELTRTIDELERELALLVAQVAPRLLAERCCGVLIAAKLVGEIAGVTRFATDAKLARIARSARIPASTGNSNRHRLDRGGNPQINLGPIPVG
jgi:transposase